MSDEHAVIVTLGMSEGFGTSAEREEIQRLGDELKRAVVAEGVGTFDGDGFGHGEAELYFYGPSADDLLAVIEPVVLGAYEPSKIVDIVKRYGELGAPGKRVTWDKRGRRRERAFKGEKRRKSVPPPQLGDVVELKTSDGFAYVQYTHEHPTYGELVRVLPGVYEARLDRRAVASLLKEKTVFHSFVFLEESLKEPRLARVIGNFRIPRHAKAFPVFRDGLPDPKTGEVTHWVLWDGKRQWPVGALTAEQRKLPVRTILLLEDVAEDITRGYQPEHDLITRRSYDGGLTWGPPR
jgi:hypothetical protein